MAVKWREKRVRGGRWKEGKREHDGKEAMRIGKQKRVERQTDRAHAGGGEMASARQTERGVDEGAEERAWERKKGQRRQ